MAFSIYNRHVGNSRGKMGVILLRCGCMKCVITLCSCSQVTERKNWALYLGQFCRQGIMESQEVWLLRVCSCGLWMDYDTFWVRHQLLGVELFYKGVPLQNLCMLWGFFQTTYAVKWTESDKQKGMMGGFDENGQQRLKGRNKDWWTCLPASPHSPELLHILDF